MELWKERVESRYPIVLKYNDNKKKCIVSNPFVDKAVYFSPDFMKRFTLPPVLSQKGDFWAMKYFRHSDHVNEVWQVDIYTTQLALTKKEVMKRDEFTLYPRMWSSISSKIPFLNQLITLRIKDMTGRYFDANLHKAKFLLVDDHAQLEIGKWMRLNMTENLRHMFGFNQSSFSGGSYKSNRMPHTLSETQQQLFIMCDFINPVSHGDKKLYAIEHFIHELKEKDNILEKRFFPISYFPVSTSYLPDVHMQIMDCHHQVVKIPDGKTLVVLHFRKME